MMQDGRGVVVASLWNGFGVELVDVVDVRRSDCCNQLGGAGACDCSLVVVVVSGKLGTAIEGVV